MRFRTSSGGAKCFWGLLIALTVITILWSRPGAQTKAQQPEKRAAGIERRVSDKTTLSSQIVEAQAAIDLMQLEHDADRDHLLSVMAKLRNLEIIDPNILYKNSRIVNYFNVETSAREHREENDLPESAKEFAKKNINELKNYIKINKEKYHDYSLKLSRKKLELELLRKRFNEVERGVDPIAPDQPGARD